MMQDILAALNREEALDVEKIRREAMTEPAANVAEEPIEEADLESQPSEPKSVLAEPVDNWRRLQSYLQVERAVSIEETDRGRIAKISVNLANTAPESPDWPSVVFRTITLAGAGIDTKSISPLRPGETAEANFQVPETRLLSFELSLSAEVDGDELLKFQHHAQLPPDATAPIKKRFAADFEELGVKGFVTEAVETVGRANEDLSMREMAQLRESARDFALRTDKILNDLNGVFRAYRIQREDTLGGRMRELNTTLTNFKKTVEEFDQAVGETDPDKMQEVQNSLKEAQLAVLRVEAELRSVGGSQPPQPQNAERHFTPPPSMIEIMSRRATPHPKTDADSPLSSA